MTHATSNAPRMLGLVIIGATFAWTAAALALAIWWMA